MKEMAYRTIRSIGTEFRAVEVGEDKYIECYFAVFGKPYEIYPGATEYVDEHAFDNALTDDVRCLTDHDTRLVLGRNKVGTLELRIDAGIGLWGRVKINVNDQDALNTWARVQRGDVSQCSFGFDVKEEENEYLPDGSVKWIIKSVKLYEVSIVTFPAYEDTSAVARKHDAEQIKKRSMQAWREKTKERIRNGIKTVDD